MSKQNVSVFLNLFWGEGLSFFSPNQNNLLKLTRIFHHIPSFTPDVIVFLILHQSLMETENAVKNTCRLAYKHIAKGGQRELGVEMEARSCRV